MNEGIGNTFVSKGGHSSVSVNVSRPRGFRVTNESLIPEFEVGGLLRADCGGDANILRRLAADPGAALVLSFDGCASALGKLRLHRLPQALETVA